MKIAQSPLSALRASSGDWLIFTLGLQEISSLLILRPEDLYSLPKGIKQNFKKHGGTFSVVTSMLQGFRTHLIQDP